MVSPQVLLKLKIGGDLQIWSLFSNNSLVSITVCDPWSQTCSRELIRDMDQL